MIKEKFELLRKHGKKVVAGLLAATMTIEQVPFEIGGGTITAEAAGTANDPTDELYIPQMQSTVKMSGAVTYPNSVTYTKGMSVMDCLSQAGGYNDIARKYPIVIYMNGKVATTKRTAIFFKRYPKVEPGCEIVVPTKTQRERRSLAEIMSISSSATSMAAMITSIVNMIKN